MLGADNALGSEVRGDYPASHRRLSASGSALVFSVILIALVLTHFPLLRLPYFWDEAGYYIPAARDLFATGSLIPVSGPSNAHPPLVSAYLALCWKIAGFSPLVTHLAMVLVAAFFLTGVFRLAQRVANTQVATAAVACTALYPVMFVQTTLAQVDMTAAALTFWGLLAYFEKRFPATVVWFSLAVLAKETAVLTPLALLLWELTRSLLRVSNGVRTQPRFRVTLALATPVVPLLAWYMYHYLHRGFVFGNPEFYRYNVQATLQPVRIFLALLLRIWQMTIYMGLYLLTGAALLALRNSPLRDQGEPRPRIVVDIQLAFLTVIATYLIALSVVGGAVLARYLLGVVPLLIIVCVSTLWRRIGWWREIVALVILGFLLALFVNPPYGFSFEDNLAYHDYVVLHQHAAAFLEGHDPASRLLTAWPASDELTRPDLGYVTRLLNVVPIENFAPDQLLLARGLPQRFDTVMVFSTKYDAPFVIGDRWPRWRQWKARFFGYHQDVQPVTAAKILGGRLTYSEWRHRQWVGVIEMDQIQNAGLPPALVPPSVTP
ncbi:MAG: glycosyltransferase family 39 protein [Acidobacteriales bacterium]|nr:glycosyltransferase family 39 protein [Terriglobales bacterium]